MPYQKIFTKHINNKITINCQKKIKISNIVQIYQIEYVKEVDPTKSKINWLAQLKQRY